MRDCQGSVTTGQTHMQIDGQATEKMIPMCRYASQATQKTAVYTKYMFSPTLNLTPNPCPGSASGL